MRNPSPFAAVPSGGAAPGAPRPRGFAAASRALGPELHRSCRRLGVPEHEIDDVVQDALLRAWTFRRSFQEGTNFRAWLHRVLRNVAMSRHRRARREREGLERLRRDPGPSTFGALPSSEGLDDDLRAALDALPAEFRAVVELVDLGGRPYREAATALGCPVGTVMSRLHRARRALRSSLASAA